MTRTYRLAMAVTSLIVGRWGRMEVTGLDALPADGPILLAGNHDSYWDPIAIGVAARRHRQIHALAKEELWKVPLLAPILNGMAQIPIGRGKADAGAMDRALDELRGGACIGIFPEGTRSGGRELRARSGFGRLAADVPEARIVCVSVVGTVDVPRLGVRPRIRVRFFAPALEERIPGEDAAALGARLLAEIRAEAPPAAAGWRRPRG